MLIQDKEKSNLFFIQTREHEGGGARSSRSTWEVAPCSSSGGRNHHNVSSSLSDVISPSPSEAEEETSTFFFVFPFFAFFAVGTISSELVMLLSSSLEDATNRSRRGDSFALFFFPYSLSSWSKKPPHLPPRWRRA